MTDRATDPATLSKYLRKVTGDLRDARGRIGELEARQREPIAIVGISCRYPGGVGSPEELWQLLDAGTDAISGFPADRGWDLERLYDPDPDHPGTSYAREGGFLHEAAEFDAEFFGISPREARVMDPQYRLLLEAAWEACEDAGVDPAALAGSDTGVFTGLMYHDYGVGSGVSEMGGSVASGSAASGRLAYTFGLEGPAVSVDTACSSSLVAMHLAAGALRGGECDLALVGGASVMATPTMLVDFSRQRGLAPDGRCKPFAAAADGTALAEGCGLLLLERLSDAEANGHEVIALIRASAVNQDGASNGPTAPNGPSQERVIRQALANAGLTAAEVDAVEAHGTGTTLGDPIEAGAILATYGQGRDGAAPLRLGSIKSNLGHTQAAAGVAGVIKMALALRHGVLPRTLHVDAPSPHVDWSTGAVELLREPREWGPGERPRRAGVSSFGASGTNAHLILEEAPAGVTEEGADPRGNGAEPAQQAPAIAETPAPLILSAKSEPALREGAARLAAHLRANPELDRGALAATLAARARLPQRAAVLPAEAEELPVALDALAAGLPHAELLEGEANAGKLAFICPGQGSQWQGMGRELLESSPAFAAHVAACEEALAPYVDFSLEAVLRGDAHSERVEVIQPALFAMTVSLAALWRSHGVEPAAVLGHSQGEIAAAHLAGALSLEDAARVVALRSQALTELAGKGGMASLALPAEQAKERIAPWGQSLHLAAHNSPIASVVSGEPEALAELIAACEAAGVRARLVAVDYASHSAQVEAIAERLAQELAPIAPGPAAIPFYSALSAGPLAGEELGAEYWYRSLREPVRFEAAIASLLEGGFGAFVELSAHPVLSMAVEECAAAHSEAPVAALGSLRREEGGLERFGAALAAAHVSGVEVEWAELLGGGGRVPLPGYPFQRRRYWLSGGESGDVRAAGLADAEHPLLGAAISLPGESGWLFSGRLSLRSHPWLADHAVFGGAVFPGTAFMEITLRAAEQAGLETIEEMTIAAPLALPEQGAVQVQVSVGAADEDGRRPLSIHSRPEGGEESEAEWTRHADGVLGPAGTEEPEGLGEWPPPGAEPVAVDDLYEGAAELGLDYGPAFQGLKAAWRRGEELFAEVELGEEQASEAGRYGIHPALLDAAFHVQLLAAVESGAAFVPFASGGVRLLAAGASRLRVRLAPAGSNPEVLSLLVADSAGTPVATAESVLIRPISSEQLAASREAAPDSLFTPEWIELPLPEQGGEGEIRRFECAPPPGLDPPAAALALCEEVLAALREAIAAGEQAPLAFITNGALASEEGEVPDPAMAAARGLVRSAQAEHPGRFLLLDSDGSKASAEALTRALALEGEPQLALRQGALLAPRLTRAPKPDAEPAPIDPEGTVLITGASGTLGGLLARHLVSQHGARHLLLASRRGAEAPGAKELVAELGELGAEADVIACDVAERDQLAELIGSVSPEHPLGAVIHCAGLTDDGLVDSLDPERLAKAMAPKAEAAWHLHQLTQEIEGCELILFSSVAGTLQTPGQGNYAAANAFLDALAGTRKAEGLAALSLGWGAWQSESTLTARLSEADRARIARAGIGALTEEEGLALFDRARAHQDPHLIAAKLDPAALRANARAGTLPALLSGLVRVPARRAAGASSLAERLAAVPEPEREAFVLELVRSHVAAVLAHPSGAAIDPKAAFKDLGFDSLAAVELRNRLGQATGLRLPATLVFDYPSAEAVAGYLRGEAEGIRAAPAPASVRARSEEPIAIVGISCRYPGGVGSPEELWQLLEAGTDAISGFPEDRGWDLERLYDPDPDHPGTSYAREGGFLHDAAEFDAEFFGISPREALVTDPQQRLLLEGAWEAFEDAGIDPASLAGSDTGVFAGLMHHDYGMGSGTSELGGATASGSAASGRIAYIFGLQGPAVTVDTACSSSLVAMHLAAGALRGGECGLALAGGSTVLGTPTLFVDLSRQRGLAPDGRCKAFAAAADGAGFSEGCGLLLLERLADAEANGHEVIALIRGSAVNQDGASNGPAAPHGPSQERVIRQALANAGLTAAEVDAVEAHGTGTTLGDPIEAGAILATYGQGRERPLALGSVKSNLGHTQAAAGVAGVIKMTLALRHGVLPRTLHVDAPSPHVDWSAGAVELLREPREWGPGERPRRAGVSSFGMSGTNAHLILEEAPPRAEAGVEAEPPPLPVVPLLLSAKSEPALREGAARLAAHLRRDPGLDPAALAAALVRRARLPHRAVVLAAEAGELPVALDALAAGLPHADLIEGEARPGRLAFLFSGQGAQRAGMGSELAATFPVFGAALDAVCAELDPHLQRPLQEVLFAAPGSAEAALLDRTEFTQPALFAIEVALFRLLQSWGLEPDFLIGHSIGELAAAHVAGVFGLADACRLIAARGALMGALPEGGAMVAVEAAEGEVGGELPAGLSIAAVNSPTSLVVSGAEGAALEWAEGWRERGRKTTRLRVSHAFHSELMEPMLAEFAAVAATVSYDPPRIPIVSNLSGESLTSEQATDPAYWVAQVREPVRFAAGIDHLAAAAVAGFLELGPDGALTAMARSCLAGAEPEAAVAAAMRRERPEVRTLLAALATLDAGGAEVGWGKLLGAAPGKPVRLPPYPFQRRRYWLAAGDPAGNAAAAGLADARHPLLGAETSLPGEGGWLFSGRLSQRTHPWLAEHAVLGTAIVPGSAFAELALHAGDEIGAAVLEEMTIAAPLALPEQGAVQIQVSVGAADEDGRRPLSIHSRPEGGEESEAEWTRHADGVLGPAGTEEPEGLGEWPPPGAEPVAVDDLYEGAAELGLDYGPAFQGLKAAWRRGEEIFAAVELGEEQASEAGRYGIHPALLDAALHASALEAKEEDALRVPFAWSGVRLFGSGAAALRVRLAPAGEGAVSVTLDDASGAPALSIESSALRPLEASQLAASREAAPDSLFAPEWIELPLPEQGGEGEIRRFECAPAPDLDPPAAALALCEQVLEALREAIAAAGEDRLAFITEGALASEEGEAPDPAMAAARGLIRSAQAEHPGRFLLIDSDGSEASEAALSAALALEGEPQLALRQGALLAPRLARAPKPEEGPAPIDPEGTVLITGASGTLGTLFARHLVSEHGVSHLLLASRRGPEAPGAEELVRELSELGAQAELAACDVADADQLAELIASVPPERPLRAVLHCAGLTDDGLVDSLDSGRLQKTMAPKAEAAWHLHQLTQEIEGCELILFSSVAGTLQSAGQGNYAAANAFLDALAGTRKAEGLHALSIGWGAWQSESTLTARLSEADRARIARAGIAALKEEEGLALFDRARAHQDPHLIAAKLDPAALRANARAGTLPALLSGLVRVPARRAAGSGSLAERLAAVPEPERDGVVLELVRSHVAAVLAHPSASAIDPKAAFKELGFDSLAAVELRNRLGQATGLRLPATLVFDYPSAEAVAGYLRGEAGEPGAESTVEDAIDGLRTLLEALAGDERERAEARLRSLLSGAERGRDDAGAETEERIRSASAEELLQIVNEEIGAR